MFSTPADALAVFPVAKGATEFRMSKQLGPPDWRALPERPSTDEKKYGGWHQRNERVDDADTDTREPENSPDQ